MASNMIYTGYNPGNMFGLGMNVQSGVGTRYESGPTTDRWGNLLPNMYDQPETESERTLRLIDEYRQYIRDIELAAGNDPKRKAYARSLAMTPQEFAARDAQKRAARKIEITGATKTKVGSDVADPFVEVAGQTIGTGPLARKTTKRVRLSEKLAGEQKAAALESRASQKKAKEDIATFQDMVAKDTQLQGDPEMAAKLEMGIEAISKGSTPENAMLLVKGAGQAQRIQQTRKEEASKAARAEAQKYRIELAKINNDFSMEKMNEAFANQQKVKQETREWQAAMENWKANRQDARARQQAAAAAQKLKATFDSNLPGVEKMIQTFNSEIYKMESAAPDPNTPEYEKYLARVENIRSGLQNLQNVRESFMQVPDEVKTANVQPLAAPTPTFKTTTYIIEDPFTKQKKLVNESQLSQLNIYANESGLGEVKILRRVE